MTIEIWNLVWNFFEMSQQFFDENLSFYQNVFLSKCLFIFLLQFCLQKYCVWRGPYEEIWNFITQKGFKIMG